MFYWKEVVKISAIKIKNLTKKYDDFKAVDDLSLNVESGIVYGFLGPNGAGKSTTILSMLGLITPTEGDIEILDMSIFSEPVKIKEKVGFLPEDGSVYGELSAWQNLKFLANFYEGDSRVDDERIEELLELVNLDDVMDKKTKGFSKGMKQRLLLAQTLLNDPEVLILDEPTSGLDPEGSSMVKRVIKEEKARGKTIFFSSHILSEVEEVCDEIGILVEGEIKAEGSLDDIKNKFMDLRGYEIRIETKNALPELDFDEISEIKRLADNKVVIHSHKDIRNQISDFLYDNDMIVRNLEINEPSLEEIFLDHYEQNDSRRRDKNE